MPDHTERLHQESEPVLGSLAGLVIEAMRDPRRAAEDLLQPATSHHTAEFVFGTLKAALDYKKPNK